MADGIIPGLDQFLRLNAIAPAETFLFAVGAIFAIENLTPAVEKETVVHVRALILSA
jgi:hypothetical protein